MKTGKFFAVLLIILVFYNCATTQFEQNPPFTITSAVYNNWYVESTANKGKIVNIGYDSKYVVKFDSIYFSKRAEKLTMSKVKDKKMISAIFSSTEKPAIILHENSTKEIHNPLPELKKMPFELKKNEAIISYKIKDKTKYFKIKSIKKGKTIFYDSIPKQ
ncbi:hypothetical protein LPB03_09920 [Polaribacter vadi]|uniref:Lipoprotein n=1 Tax=Polaribacter vadi TaxID=1774273 RepID=A0A1B8TSG0_9FLAO|nr:hypothetical protein [Polaribacter vadi]AOW17751.1 hypothetical protein LPB03_09920 [Polaribacter vadi]OBY62475.1 hypothetical protein LPB3_09930 [Polaribacter vadi]